MRTENGIKFLKGIEDSAATIDLHTGMRAVLNAVSFGFAVIMIMNEVCRSKQAKLPQKYEDCAVAKIGEFLPQKLHILEDIVQEYCAAL